MQSEEIMEEYMSKGKEMMNTLLEHNCPFDMAVQLLAIELNQTETQATNIIHMLEITTGITLER